MIIGYLGPEGTFTERALELFRPEATRIALPNLEAVFQATHSREINLGFVPVENSIEGPVTQTYDLLFRYADKLHIIDATLLPIKHALGALLGTRDIKRIYSKDTALAQCSRHINVNYPDVELVPVDSTTKAMERIAEEGLSDAAAIGREDSLVKYGLEIIASDIADAKNNKTRFIVLGDRTYQSKPTGKDVTSVVVYPHRDRVGLLEDILDVISTEYKLNMSSLQSRPDERGGYRFYINLEGHISDKRISDCINGIDQRLKETDVVVLGSYPLMSFTEQRIKTIAIIGGTGKMGSEFFKPFFESSGYNVLISGRKTRLSYKGAIRRADAVIINVPIEETARVIQEIGPYLKPGQLLVENAGVKTNGIVDAMLQYTSEGVEVLDLHTLFSEKIESIVGRNVVSIRTEKSGEMAQEFENIFYKYGANIVRVSPEQHDLAMALVQFGEHLPKIIQAYVVNSLMRHPDELKLFSTPNSEISEILMARVLSGDPHLYSVMAGQNPYAIEVGNLFQSALHDMLLKLRRGDASTFEDYMEQAKRTVGEEFIARGVTLSNLILSTLEESNNAKIA